MLTAIDEAMPARLTGENPALALGQIAVAVTTQIEDVEAPWRALTAATIESPGQNYDFIRAWVPNETGGTSMQFFDRDSLQPAVPFGG